MTLNENVLLGFPGPFSYRDVIGLVHFFVFSCTVSKGIEGKII